MYGLRQAPRLFQEFFARELEKIGWVRLQADPQFFVHPDGTMPGTRADDLLLTAACADIVKFQTQISEHMVIKWGDDFTDEAWVKCLGREWRLVPHGIAVRNPPHYYDKLLDLMPMKDCKAMATPGAISECLPEQAAQPVSLEEASHYRSVVGKIVWMLPERSDLSFSGKELARHVQAPTIGDYKSLKHLVRYVTGTKEDYTLGLEDKESEYQKNNMNEEVHLEIITDANWRGEADGKSTSGGVLRLGSWILQTRSRTQSVVALSSCEPELLSMSVGAGEARLAQSLLSELGEKRIIHLITESSGARAITQRRGPGKLRQIALREL